MAYYITIDGGTTNTRVRLMKEEAVADCRKISLGAKDNSGGNSEYKAALKNALDEIIGQNELTDNNIRAIIACGMITCEKGLCEVDHICAPAGVKELRAAIKTVLIKEICNIPFSFIPGIKSVSDDLDSADMMRGEEAEIFGLEENISDSLIILPGSHSKCIKVTADRKISSFKTFLTGEFLFAVVNDTILKSSVDLDSCLDAQYLKRGYEYCENHGVNAALFKTRVLSNMFSADKDKCYSFVLGVVLHDEIEQLILRKESKIIIAGQNQLKNSMALLLDYFSSKKVICASEKSSENAAAVGMLRIYKG